MIEDFKESDYKEGQRKYIKFDDKGMIITDEKDERDRDSIFCDKVNIEATSRDKIVMVHCTDFFPRNHKILTNYEGKKKESSQITYNGQKKECESISHRHTVHFTLNNRVTNTGDGMRKLGGDEIYNSRAFWRT